jgi:hypothetical protein
LFIVRVGLKNERFYAEQCAGANSRWRIHYDDHRQHHITAFGHIALPGCGSAWSLAVIALGNESATTNFRDVTEEEFPCADVANLCLLFAFHSVVHRFDWRHRLRSPGDERVSATPRVA